MTPKTKPAISPAVNPLIGSHLAGLMPLSARGWRVRDHLRLFAARVRYNGYGPFPGWEGLFLPYLKAGPPFAPGFFCAQGNTGVATALHWRRREIGSATAPAEAARRPQAREQLAPAHGRSYRAGARQRGRAFHGRNHQARLGPRRES